MSDTQIAALDHTVQLTNLWLKTLVEEHHFSDRQEAYNALRAVLQTLRDQLTIEQAVHLSAQLPMLVRGIYFENWHIGAERKRARSVEDFERQVAERLPPFYRRDAKIVSKAVFDLLWREIDPAFSQRLVDELPAVLRPLWLAVSGR